MNIRRRCRSIVKKWDQKIVPKKMVSDSVPQNQVRELLELTLG
jgi:hypothetical protein